jgi:predicted glycosyltransferase
MKTIKLKLEQIATRKVKLSDAIKEKQKDGKIKTIEPAVYTSVKETVSINTAFIEFKDNKQAVNIALEFMTEFYNIVQVAKVCEQNFVTFGGTKFMLNKGFDLYLNVNGQDYSLADVMINKLGAKLEIQFRLNRLDVLGKGILSILLASEGKNLLTSVSDTKKIESSNKNLLLNA